LVASEVMMYNTIQPKSFFTEISETSFCNYLLVYSVGINRVR
jgi:hypothetical protein